MDKINGYLQRNKNMVDKILEENNWSLNEIKIILDNILNQKFEVINDIVPLLNNKTLDNLVWLLLNQLHIGGRTPIRIRLNCFTCNKELIRPISEYKKSRVYCSYECRDKYKTIYLSGENSQFYHRVSTQCTNCGKEIKIIPYYANTTNNFGDEHHFCSQNCYLEYRSKYYVQEKHSMFGAEVDEKHKRMASQRLLKMISEGRIPQTLTKPHKIINNVLLNNDIEYRNEESFKYYSVDIYMQEYNLIIEIMGDYWHCSPVKYAFNELNDIQKKSIRRDKAKRTYIKKYYGINILYLWEYDIIHNLKVCEELIKMYIDNNGVLIDYNSFNYSYSDGLVLNSNIVQPYFINIECVQTAG